MLQTVPRFNLLTRHFYSSVKTSVGVLGVPFEAGASKKGASDGPKALREYGIIKKLKRIHDNMDVKDYGDLQYAINKNIESKPQNMLNYEQVTSATQQLSNKCYEIIKDGRICLTIGGDHSLGIGTVDAHVRAKSEDKVALLWIDAHADLNTNKTSESGNIHGMPVAILAKELADYWPYLPGMDWQKPIMSIRNIAYIGLRSVDAYERYVIDQMGIIAFGMEEIEKYGINTVMSMALERIDSLGNRSLHVSFDIDSLDTLEAPSTGTPVRGGLSLREGLHIMETIYKTGRLGAMDLVEVNPWIGDEKDVKITLEAATEIILAAFGQSRRGLWPRTGMMKQT